METQLGNLINLGGSLAMTIPKELVNYLRITKTTMVKKTWNPATNTLEIQFVEMQTEPIETANQNSVDFSNVCKQWRIDNGMEGED